MLLCGCKKEEEPRYTTYTQREAGAPNSDWGMSTTGSVKYLDGTTVLVTIYLDDVDSLWLDSDEQLVADNVKTACDYLTEEGKKYGKDVKLIYDTSEGSDLVYRISYKEAFAGSTQVKREGDKTEKLVYAVYDYVEHKIDSEALLEKYNANSIGYMVFIDGEADKCTAYCYHTKYKEYFYHEFCLINIRWTGGYEVYPDTYAHEILHLFGARDLYYTNEYDGTSKSFIDYVYEEYSKDIMLGNATDVVAYEDAIVSEITDITAYYLGWTNYITELEEYPYIKSEYIASFSASSNTQGANFIEYNLTPRKARGGSYADSQSSKLSYSKISSLIMAVLMTIILVRFIIINHREKKLMEAEKSRRSVNVYSNPTINASLDYMNRQYMDDSSVDYIKRDSDEIKDE